jgi:hypothetical protein
MAISQESHTRIKTKCDECGELDSFITSELVKLCKVNLVLLISLSAKMTYAEAHDILGHMGEEATRKAARQLGWQVSGPASVCEYCAVGKAKQQSLPQVSSSEPLKENERRVHLDISTIKPKPGKDGEKVYQLAKPNWRLIVDAKTHPKFSEFLKTKDGMVEPTCVLFKEWKDAGRPVTHLRMDNGGENIKLIERCKSAQWQLGIKKFELTARDTPQQNAPVEVGFNTLATSRKCVHGALTHYFQKLSKWQHS